MSDSNGAPGRVLAAVALVSVSLIAYEIVLMRRLLIESWHHFGYLVISAALLGFGASGTLLAILERRVRRHTAGVLWFSAIALTVSLVVAPRAAAALPVTARFIPDDLAVQAGWWSLYWLMVGLPFLCGATHIGAALMTAGPRVGRVYGVNLFGSAIGAVAGGLLVSRLPIEVGLWPSIVLALAAAGVLAVTAGRRTRETGVYRLPTAGTEPGRDMSGSAARDIGGRSSGRRAALLITVVVVLCAVLLESVWPSSLSPDEYKYLAYVRRLCEQGSARRVAHAADPHGYVEIYESPLFHDLAFLAISQRPPPMLSILINGNPAGSALRIKDAAEAGVMDRTLMAFPYRLAPKRPRVLLLGETGGTNVWLARRRSAEHIRVVQPNGGLVRLLRGPVASKIGGVLDAPAVSVRVDDPRAVLRRGDDTFDLIQIVAMEGLGGAAGLGGLAEDHLATVEGFAACLRRLSPGGVVSVCRGVQEPQRENIRILATWVEALESLGIVETRRHIVQVRDYLGVCTMVLKSPLDGPRSAALVQAISEFNLNPVWYADVPVDLVNRPHESAGPPGTTIDWLHYACREIFSERREAFYRSWLSNVRPVHDDAPFFWDFYKPEALPRLKAAYGDLWLTRAELGRLFLYASLLIGAAAAVFLILLPLGAARLWARHATTRAVAPSGSPTVAMVLYFAGIGLGFMGIEMALISRAIGRLGDPVVASAAVIGGVLVLSGLGSLFGARFFGARVWAPGATVATLAAVVAATAFSSYAFPTLAPVASVVIALAAVPLAFCMGMPMPAGLAALSKHAPGLLPWAWGVNGVASVIATSLAIVVAMTHGYRYVLALACAMYVLAAVAALFLGSGQHRRRSGHAS